MMRKVLFLALLFVGVLSLNAQVIAPPTTVPPANAPSASITLPSSMAAVRSNRLGITFINSAQVTIQENRYQNALRLGAGWTRWPLYWDVVESAPDTWSWDAYDKLVLEDLRHGLNINAIFLGMPGFHKNGDIPSGLNTPIFADGTDSAGAGKALNPDNKWAQFIFQAVTRYKPNGTLAQARNLRAGQGVRVWEVWNEPDFEQFWRGGINNYARLLKVSYIVAKLADPQAQIMFGGLLYNTPDNWLARVLAIFANDPQGARNNYYFDIVAIHNYGYPWRTGWLTLYARETLRSYKISRPIWVNESGVTVWDDYPGPVWTTQSVDRLGWATADQQAWFFIQSTAYAWSEGADVVFFHQLYDDCGDQAAGTDFPPHNGELCGQGNMCFGNAFGIYRNPRGSVCFSQHPQPESPRPVANAFRLMAEVFGRAEFKAKDKAKRFDDGSTRIQFDRPATQERVTVIWNRRFEERTISITAEGTNAQLFTLSGNRTLTPDATGNYTLTLAAAQPDAFPYIEPNDISAIGGAPVLLVERPLAGLDAPAQTNLPTLVPVTLEPTVTALPLIQPTTSPDGDNTPPRPFMNGLPIISATTFNVSWGATDNGEVVNYLVWVRLNGGEWQPWIETKQTQAQYTGIVGNRYEFAVWAQDAAGNWSTNTTLEPMASTQIE